MKVRTDCPTHKTLKVMPVCYFSKQMKNNNYWDELID